MTAHAGLGSAAAWTHRQPLALEALAAAQRRNHWRIVAAAGIGMPDRFFAMLRGRRAVIEELPLADHFDFVANPFTGLAADRILITEKDAVKCVGRPGRWPPTRASGSFRSPPRSIRASSTPW